MSHGPDRLWPTVRSGPPSHGCPFWQPSCAFRWSAPDGPKRLGTAPTHKADGREFFLVRRTAAACVSNLLPHVDTGGCSSDGDTLHGPVFYGRTGAMPASAVRIGPNRQQYGTGSLQDEDQFPLVEVPQKS